MSEKLSGIRDFIGLHRKAVIGVTAAVLLAAGAAAAFFAVRKSNAKSTTNYREYTVSRGDVTVGTTESGTVALDSQSISFPVACKVDSVLVKSGAAVKKGEPLVRLDLGSISDSTSETRQKLEAAKVSLQSALNDQKVKLETAKITYESSKDLATTAPVTRQLTEAELQQNIASAQTALKNDQSSLANYQSLQKSWPADDAKLQKMQKWMDDAATAKTSYTNQLSKFNSDNSAALGKINTLKTAMENAETTYYQAQYGDDDEAAGDKALYDEAKDAYNDYMSSTGQTVLNQQAALQDKVAEATAEAGNYSTAYNNFSQTYSDKYKSGGSSLSQSDIDQKVSSLENTVKQDQYNLEKAQKTAQISSLNAQTKEEGDLSTASNADGTYQLTVNQLQEAVTAAQQNCDKLNDTLTEVNNALNGNGVLTAPCNGFVAQVDSAGGSSAAADAAILTLSETDSITMDVSISEDDIPNVSLGQDASLSLSSYEGQTFDGVVENITAEPARSGSSSVTYTVAVRSKENTGSIGTVYDGMSGEATIIQKQAKNVLNVSDRAITFRNGISTVLVKNADGSQSSKTVKTGFSDGSSVEILSGLEQGDTVLAESTVSSK